MAGVKGRSGGPRANAGGARPGAGRPKKEAPANPYKDPLEFLQAVWTGEVEATVAQVRAATAALPFKHRKLGEGSNKKEDDEAKRKAAGEGRFGRRVAPTLAAANGKAV
jgi:phage terminase small subunit